MTIGRLIMPLNNLYILRGEAGFNECRRRLFIRIGARLVIVISQNNCCLLYTSDAADDLLCVDLGGRRIIKKKKNTLQS